MDEKRNIANRIKDFYNQKPKYVFEIDYENLHYMLNINRKFTIIQGDSATGKSVLLEALLRYKQRTSFSKRSTTRYIKDSASLTVKAPVEYIVNPINYESIADSKVIFLDENHPICLSEDLLIKLLEDGYYIVLTRRENYIKISYPVSEIYKITDAKRHKKYDNIISREYINMIMNTNINNTNISKIILEDSNVGFKIISEVFKDKGISIETVNGKDNIIPKVKELIDNNNFYNTLIIVDSVNYGQRIKELKSLLDNTNNSILLFEPLEFLILETLDIFNKVSDIINNDLISNTDKLDYNFEKVFNSILKFVTAKMSIDKCSTINNEALEYLFRNINFQYEGRNIVYSERKITKHLFTDSRIDEL